MSEYLILIYGDEQAYAAADDAFAQQLMEAHNRFSEQIEVSIRQHALESGCFVVSATAWLDADQQAQIMRDTDCPIDPTKILPSRARSIARTATR